MVELPLHVIRDSFLAQADLFLLEFSPDGKLQNVRPQDAVFWGWEADNKQSFDIETHLLSPNHLTINHFQNFYLQNSPLPERMVFLSPTLAPSPLSPVNWYFHSGAEAESKILILVSTCHYPEYLSYPKNKIRSFHATFLNGFIHNIMGTLGTLLGRAELLSSRTTNKMDIEPIITQGYRLKEQIENVRFKVSHDNSTGKSPVNFNRMLKEEIKFLRCDLFFKHRVHVQEDYQNNIPQFKTNYWALSGVLNECYLFCRSMMNLQKDYQLYIRSFSKGDMIGFEFLFEGVFSSGKLGITFPFQLEGTHETLLFEEIPSLDCFFLANCMKHTEGTLKISFNHDTLQVQYAFPTNHPVSQN